MSHISLLELEKIKRKAKKLKNKLSKLSHGQRLDIVSRNLFKVRNYHEAKVQCKKYINSQVNQNGSVSECSYCQLTFVASEKADLKAHNHIHLEYEKAEHALGYLPASYKTREKEKKEAYKELNKNNSFSMKMDGALRLIRAHFDRSLEHSIGGEYWREHPTFEEYLSKIDEYTNIIPAEIMDKIRNKYGKDLEQIDNGKSYWYPSKT